MKTADEMPKKVKVDLCRLTTKDAPALSRRLARRAEEFEVLVQQALPDAPSVDVLQAARVKVMDAVSDLLSLRGVNER